MPTFCANLTMMFTENACIDRFGAAKDAGFDVVEILFPYNHPAQEMRSALLRHDLKLALLSGEPMPAVLLRLRGLTASSLEASGDDGLDGVLAEIDLRAQVEIAKREAA